MISNPRSTSSKLGYPNDMNYLEASDATNEAIEGIEKQSFQQKIVTSLWLKNEELIGALMK